MKNQTTEFNPRKYCLERQQQLGTNLLLILTYLAVGFTVAYALVGP